MKEGGRWKAYVSLPRVDLAIPGDSPHKRTELGSGINGTLVPIDHLLRGEGLLIDYPDGSLCASVTDKPHTIAHLTDLEDLEHHVRHRIERKRMDRQTSPNVDSAISLMSVRCSESKTRRDLPLIAHTCFPKI